MVTRIVIAILLLVTLAWTAEARYILNAKRLSSTEVGITCANHGDPAGTKIGETLIISCGGGQ